jgi:hypothetical protein
MGATSLLEYRTRAQQLSDTENDPNISTAEWNALANRHLSEVYDRLVDAGPPDYYAAATSITTSDGVAEYPLVVGFRNLTGVWVLETDGRKRPIEAMPTNALSNYKAPTGSWTLRIEYIPTPPTLEADGDTFDGVSGWDELITCLMARDVMIKRESDPSAVLASIAKLEQRITMRARQRDRGPKRTVDLDDIAQCPWPYGWASGSRIAAYRLRAGNLELYEPFWGYP